MSMQEAPQLISGNAICWRGFVDVAPLPASLISQFQLSTISRTSSIKEFCTAKQRLAFTRRLSWALNEFSAWLHPVALREQRERKTNTLDNTLEERLSISIIRSKLAAGAYDHSCHTKSLLEKAELTCGDPNLRSKIAHQERDLWTP